MGSHDEEGLQGRGVRLSDLLQRLIPAPGVVLRVAILALVVGSAAAVWVSVLGDRGVRVAYTRKLFHFVIFTTAAFVHFVWGLSGTVVLGSVVAGMVLASVLRGDGHPFYEALAREKDRPHRTLFIIVPLVTTAVGGLASSILAGPFAAVGFLAAGWGDAVGEPVGARWGRHAYRVPSLAGVAAERTLEGSAAVLLVASGGSAVALASLGLADTIWWSAPVCGLVAAGVEAVSNHGLDNLTVQLVPSLVAMTMLG